MELDFWEVLIFRYYKVYRFRRGEIRGFNFSLYMRILFVLGFIVEMLILDIYEGFRYISYFNVFLVIVENYWVRLFL